MALIRPILFSLLLVPMIACGGDDTGDADDTDDTDDSDGVVVTGEHYKYVAKEVFVPSANQHPGIFGLNVDNDADGVDNKLGTAIVTIGTTLMNATLGSEAVTTNVNNGSIIFLADVQTEDFSTAAGAGFVLSKGANPMPMACTDPATPATCGQHLMGTGMFTSSAASAQLKGSITGGTMTAGPGALTLQIALGDSEPLDLDLVLAQIKVSGLDESGTAACTIAAPDNCVRIAGAITDANMDTKVLPAIKASLIDPLLAELCDMAMAGTPEHDRCGCTGSAQQVISLLDDVEDCMVTVQEIKDDNVVGNLIKPDITLDGCAAPCAISVGVMASLTTAEF
jgi:hypothetical protein